VQNAGSTAYGSPRTMALRRRDVIIAIIIAFISWGFVTHWVPTLRYLPYAFIAGAASTVAILGWLIISTSRGKQYQERSREGYGARHVAFVTPETWKMETEALKRRSQYKREALYPASFVISDNFDLLIDLILRDFVSSWYGNISSRPTFANEVDRAVRAALSDIRDRVLAVDMVEIVVSRMVPLITSHMRDFYEAERVVRGKRLTRSFTESEELDLAIAGKYNDGKLHPAASLAYSNTKLVQQQHLRGIVTRLIPKVLPRSMTTSPAVIVLIKEIVACAVLFPVMQMLSDPDTWNQLMEAYVRVL
jgi:sorting nexin-25